MKQKYTIFDKNIAAFAIILFSFLNTFSQDFKEESYTSTSTAKSTVGGASEQSGLTQFKGTAEVDLYTCRAKFNIPIYTLKSYELEIPIQLSYLSGGVKVQNFAGWVGTDWNLQAASKITREVQGLPDELPNIGYFSNAQEINNYHSGVLNESAKLALLNKQEHRDIKPDIFHFNFGKYSGYFMFDGDLSIHFFPVTNVKTKYFYDDKNRLSGFEFVTPEGIRYIFGNDGACVEETFMQTQSWTYQLTSSARMPWYIANQGIKNFTVDPYTSAWYLTKIVSANGDYINFSYSDSKTIKYVTTPQVVQIYWDGKIKTEKEKGTDGRFDDYFKPVFHAFYIHNRISTDEVYTISDEDLHTGKDEDVYYKHGYEWYKMPLNSRSHYSFSQSRFEITKRTLSSIQTKTGNKVEFISSYSSNRMPNEPQLDKIKISKTLNEEVVAFALEYENVKSKSLTTDPDPLSFAWAALFKQFGWSEDNSNPANLVCDYIPNITDTKGLILEDYLTESLKDYNYYRLFLKKITKHESNTSYPPHIFTYIDPSDLPRRTSPSVSTFGYKGTNSVAKFYGVNVAYFPSVTFHTAGLLYSVSTPLNGTLRYEYKNTIYGAFVSKLTRNSGNGILEQYFEPSNEYISIPKFTHENYFFSDHDGMSKVISSVGDDLNLEPEYEPSPTPWKLPDPYWDNPIILSTTIISPTGRNNSEKASNASKACVKIRLLFRSSANFKNNSILYNGSPIIYNKVIVSDSPDKHNGYECYLFKNLSSNLTIKREHFPRILFNQWDNGIAYYSGVDFRAYWQIRNPEFYNGTTDYGDEINPIVSDLSYKSGLLWKHIIYGSASRGVLKTTEYSYSFPSPGAGQRVGKINGLNNYTYNAHSQFSKKYINALLRYDLVYESKPVYIATEYSYIPETIKLDWKEEITYDVNYPGDINHAITSRTSYLYNDLNQVREVTNTSSDGLELKTAYKYPSDFSGGVVYRTMVARNMLNTPIETINYKDGKTIQSVINKFVCKDYEFEYWLNDPDKSIYQGGDILPCYSYSLETNNPLSDFQPLTSNFTMDTRMEEKLSFDEYDSDGNLLQMHKKGDNPTSYIYGYNNTLPIAEVVNAKTGEIYFNNFEEDNNYSVSAIKYAQLKHTGEYCAKLLNNSFAGVYDFEKINLTSGKYIYSAWVKTNSAGVYLVAKDVDGTPWISTSVGNTQGVWTYIEKVVNIDDSDFSTTNIVRCEVWNSDAGTAYVDDVKFYPSDAQMTSYTHKPLVGVTSITDANNKTTTYEYDGLGRLIKTFDHKGLLIKEHKYNYAKPL